MVSTVQSYRNRNTFVLCAPAGKVKKSVYPMVLEDESTFACASDPDRWMTTVDDGAKALCRACPRRWACAREACRTPGAEGLWTGIFVPEAGRGRRHALKQLRELAEQNGFPVETK
jgi:WhiB family transcriptional regulator, redox-sensing transcriptional regulator